jgi:transcriptional regulator with XRE-family HTH domain
MKEILDRAGVTKKLFAELVGVSYTYVWYWENNRRSMEGPKGLKARKLLEMLSSATARGFLQEGECATKATVVAAIKQLSAPTE